LATMGASQSQSSSTFQSAGLVAAGSGTCKQYMLINDENQTLIFIQDK